MNEHNYPKLHNATWPGIVGKGPGSEPVISFDTMLEKTAAAEVDGVKFDGIDIGLFDPHIDLDMSDEGIKKLVDKVAALNLEIGTLVAPIWGGPAMGNKEERTVFVDTVRKAAQFGQKLRALGIRSNAVISIDSASNLNAWAADPINNSKLIAQTFQRSMRCGR